MRIVGLLSWFDEDPAALYESVSSHATVCDAIVALDGRYRLFRHPREHSTPEEYDAIHQACADTGMPCTTVAAPGPWDGKWGGEVAKRAELFRLALERTTDRDWLWVFDADVTVAHAVGDWRARLEQTDRHVLEVELDDEVTRRRTLHATAFRALRGLTVTEHHWHYHVPGGPVLWDYQALCVPRLDLGEQILIEHKPSQRDARRLAVRKRYYHDRDRLKIEHGLDDRRRREIEAASRATQARLSSLFHEAMAAAGARPIT